MNKEKVASSIYTVMTKKQKVDVEDPNFDFVNTTIEQIPEDKLNGFYSYLVGTRKYFNDAGFMSPFSLRDAVQDYKEDLLSELWKKYNIRERVDALLEKVDSILYGFGEKTAEEQERFSKNICFDKFLKTEPREALFSKDEVSVLEMTSLLKLLKIRTELGMNDLRDELIHHYKSFLSKKYLLNKKTSPALEGSSGQEEVNSPRTINLLGGSFKRIE